MPGALDGVTVLDFSRVLAGPYATLMLADLGATVVKVERADVGDETRAWGPPFDPTGTSTYFTSVNRNKSSIVADLRDARDIAALRERVADADVVVENFRAGTMDRAGLGYEDLRAIRPDIVYCSITGFGSGTGAALPGFDLLVQAVGGLMSITGTHPGDPTKTGVALVDVVTGLHASTGILAALLHRARTGVGQRVEVNLMSSLLSALVNQASGFVGAGVVPGILGNAHPSIAPYETFPTADRPLVVAVGTDAQFRGFAAAIGRPGIADDERFRTNSRRVAHRVELNAVVGPVLAETPADEWFERLRAHDVPAGPINTIAEAFAFAESLGLDPVVDVEGSPQVASPLTLSATPVRYHAAPPRLGAASTANPPGRRSPEIAPRPEEDTP